MSETKIEQLKNYAKQNGARESQNLPSQPTMSQVLGTSGIKELAKNLHLTSKQKINATSSALALASDPNLSSCDPFSLAKYCFEIARFNFSRSDCVYPVPFKDRNSGTTKVQAQMGYKGLRELCLQTGCYKDINCSVVYEFDEVYRDVNTGKIKVKFSSDISQIENATIKGYYAFAIDSNGELSNTLYWSLQQIKDHAKRYSESYKKDCRKASNEPLTSIWNTSFEKMAKKTLIKQLCSELKSTTPELESALAKDQIVFGGENEKDEYLDNLISNEVEDSKIVRNNLIEPKNPTREEALEFELAGTEDE